MIPHHTSTLGALACGILFTAAHAHPPDDPVHNEARSADYRPASAPAPILLFAPPPDQAAPFAPFAPFVKTRWDDRWLFIESDGLPHAPVAHQMMVGITAWQQQVPLPQPYTGENAWRIPLKPELADAPVSAKDQLFRGAIAIAANGIPIFNPIKNDGLTDTFLAGELDEFGGHCGRADDYHYHIAPLALQKVLGKDKPIAYALDGFPIYGYFDPSAKPGEDKACPLGGHEKLDALNGHFGATTKTAGPGPSTIAVPGLYHYHASPAYPYLNGGLRGKVTVKDDQIDPQPHATPVREAGTPLRGAAITGFRSTGPKAWSLEYTLGGKKYTWNYRINGSGSDATYLFEFVNPDGTKKSQTFTARAGAAGGGDRPRGDGRRGGRGPDRGPDPGHDRGPREDGNHPPTDPASPAAAPTQPPGFALTSPDVIGGRLAVECTCDGKSRAPVLAWGAPPSGTKALAIVMHHVAPDNDTHVYMVVANLPATVRQLAPADTTIGVWGQNTVNRKAEYAPPCSQGPGDKTYTITIYALSAEAKLTTPLTRDALLAAIKDTTLAAATLPVTYARANAGTDPPNAPDRARPRRGARGDTPEQPGRDRPGLLARMTEFKTEVPDHPYDLLLVRPTASSITVSVMSPTEVVGRVVYANDKHSLLQHTEVRRLAPREPAEFVLTTGLEPGASVGYRWVYTDPEHAAELDALPLAAPLPAHVRSSSERRCTLPPLPGTQTPFTFTVQADSHLDANVSPAVYLQTLANALTDKPAFHVDLGDTFMTDKRGRDFKEALPQYIAQRYYLGELCHSAPLFMALGNHDGEVGYAGDGPDSMAAWSFAQRTRFFPAPIVSDASRGPSMYSGRTTMIDGRAGNYYEFTWGAVHCIVLDPFWCTTSRPRGGGGGGGPGREKKDADVAPTDDNWSRTLGKEQYDWLTRSLESSKAAYTFVFIHHMVGGIGRANRGGVEASTFFEWGGQNADGSPGFAAHRPGWAMPIHDLLVKHHVAAVFHGHDHLCVHSQRDGVSYQCVPQPGNPAGGTRSAAEYGYTSGKILGSPGHLRIRVAPDAATVEFIRSGDANGSIADAYTLSPRPDR